MVSSPAPFCELRGVRRRFGPVVALDDVALTVLPGEVHAVLGENGAGKTTLMNVLYGLVEPDAGGILVEGRRAAIRSPADAIALGVGMVHQHFSLVPAMTVAENIALATRSERGVRLDWKLSERRVRHLAERHGLDIDPAARVGELPVGAQQRVEILKSLANDVRVLVLDEPTAALTPGEARGLFDVIRRLRDRGAGVLFVTHRLDEVEEIADRVTVLRRGRVVGEVRRGGFDASRLAALVVGRELAPPRPRSARAAGLPALEIENVSVRGEGRDAVRSATLTVHEGEIVGIAGVDGNGQGTLVSAVLGARPASGRIALLGEDVSRQPLGRRLVRGLAHITGDRHHEGLVTGFTIAENAILKKHREPAFASRGLQRLRAIEEFARGLIARFRIAATGPRQPIEDLSGGNQQKVILARELAFDPKVVVAVHPTRGLDVAAARDVQDELLALRERGRSVLLVSADLDEVLALSDRIVVAFAGTLTEVPQGERRAEAIGRMMIGGADAAAR